MAAYELVSNIEESFSLNIWFFKFMGLWVPQEKPFLKKIYFLYSFFTLGVFYNSFLVGLMAHLIIMWGNIEEMVGVLFLMVIIVSQYFKMYPLLTTSARFRKLISSLYHPRFQVKNFDQHNIINNAIKECKKISKFFISMCGYVSVFWGMFPILDGSYKEYNVPMVMWVPFDIRNDKVYPFFYFYNYCGVIMSALVNCVYDSFVFGLMIHIGAQLDILSDNLANIKFYYDKMDNEMEEEFMEGILNCVKHHQEILKYTEEMEDFVSIGILAGFGATGFVLVVTLFQMTLVSPASFEFIMLALYFSCIMFELFLYCWFGNEVTLKSWKVGEAAYKCDWHVCGFEKYKRILLLLMVRSHKPIVVRAGKLIPLSIETFMTIGKSSWSYFNLLRQVNETPEE